jgi:hypothetical protein
MSILQPPKYQTDLDDTFLNNFAVVLYGCETWSVILREEHRLMVFENRVLREKFGVKKDEITGDWRQLQTEELHGV